MFDNKSESLKTSAPSTNTGYLGIASNRKITPRAGSLGSTLALPTEDPLEVDRCLAALKADLAPRGELARILVKRVAVLSTRLDRAAAHEAVALSEKVRRAADDFDEARNAEADHLLGWIHSEPISHRRKLLATPEGVDRLIDALLGLRSDLDREGALIWTDYHESKIEAYFGRRCSDIPHSRGLGLSKAINNDFSEINPTEFEHLATESERRNWACDELTLYIDAEVARLRAHRETLDHEAIARNRAEAGRRATFDPDPTAILARKYEANTERSMFLALRELRKANAEAEARGIEPEPPLGSFRAEDFEPEIVDDEELEARLSSDKPARPVGVGFVPPSNFSEPAGTGSGVRGGRSSRGCSKGCGGRSRP